MALPKKREQRPGLHSLLLMWGTNRNKLDKLDMEATSVRTGTPQCVEAAGADCTGQGKRLSTTAERTGPLTENASRCRTTSTQTNGCRSLPDSRTSTSLPSAEERWAAQDWLHVCACGKDEHVQLFSMCFIFDFFTSTKSISHE